MVINEIKHPVLKKIRTNILGDYMPDDYSNKISNKRFADKANIFSKNIYLITDPFSCAVINSFEKIKNVSSEPLFMGLKEEKSGIFLNMQSYLGNIDVCYHFNPIGLGFEMFCFKNEELIISFFQDSNSKEPLHIYIQRYVFQEYKELCIKLEKRLPVDNDLIYNDISSFFMVLVLQYLNFLKYVEVQTKEIKSGGKLKDISCKYINNSDNNVTILDSTWFTNFYRNQGFKVRGHFRLQPYGKGKKQKRLIYITDFDKKGYVRKEKKTTL